MGNLDDAPGDWINVALPCEGCGEVTDVLVNDGPLIAGLWAEGALRIWCDECWPRRDEPPD